MHSFSRYHQGHCYVYLIGRLENGETFGYVDKAFKPFFHVRASDRDQAQKHAHGMGLEFQASSRKCMDGEASLVVSHANKSLVDKLARLLKTNKIRTYEADIKVETQYLIERGIESTCQLSGQWRRGSGVDRIYSKTQILPTQIKQENLQLKAVVLETYFDEEILKSFALIDLEQAKTLAQQESEDEMALLVHFKDCVKNIDPDVICAWAVQEKVFLPLQKRFQWHCLTFDIGRSREDYWFIERQYRGHELAIVQGRQLLDIEQLMSHTWERYDESTPECIIKEIFDTDLVPSEAGNTESRALQLTRLVDHKNLLALSLRRSLLTGLQLERCWGSIASFEFLYLLELHKKGFVAPTLGVDQTLRNSNPGGLVMQPHAGIHKNIFVFDFKSLYPSIIRSFNIDPLAYAKRGESDDPKVTLTLPNKVSFHREKGILPRTLESFFASREAAKNEHDELASFVCKILMNSFFGVLGTPGCRFAQGPVVSSVSQTSHYLLRWMKSVLETRNYKVLYGDTDSLFVDLKIQHDLSHEQAQEMGNELHRELNLALGDHLKDEFGLESCLDLEFEKFYPAFFQPSMRGDDAKGRAKSYAALKSTPEGNELEIVGLEAVRRDWTELARELQRDLLTKIFNQVPGQEIELHVQELIKDLKSGALDEQLIYRKTLSKALDSYTSTTPPHVKAARQLSEVPRVIFYYMTIAGPEAKQVLSNPIDYQHYIDKQIEPIVKSLAQHYDFSWQVAVLNQQELF
ncbi:DNA polymerase domain-containing protein [Lentisphaera marina]|uniref:DNA polymerase domain-containing protein n=1 Tax=Lentisphaera marina TaxID=1111041 RepID=UPI0023673FDE|nr:DNA polymerase domain-containing protein [Lentisphaera marina]MDD7987181.1 DNA polymerase domain-containing protein [Lentisphaera marina]